MKAIDTVEAGLFEIENKTVRAQSMPQGTERGVIQSIDTVEVNEHHAEPSLAT